jgi:hypothetical protein
MATLNFTPSQPGGLFGSPTINPVSQTSTMQNNNKGGLFGSGYNYSLNTGFTPTTTMGAQANSPVNNITPPANTIKPSQGLLAPGQKTTQGNQASPQSVAPVVPTATAAPAPVAPANTFQTNTQNLTNTQPSTGAVSAGNTAGSIATGNNQTNQQQTTQNNINQGAQTSADISQNQTPGLLAAENKYNTVANNPYMIGALTNSGMAESVSAGAGQQFASNYANQLSNANQNVQNALTGQGQQITAANNQGNIGLSSQSNQTSAAQTQGNIANTAQGNQIGAQSTVAGLPYGTPATSGANGGNLDPQTYASNLAQQVINGTMSLQDAQSSMGYAGSAGSAFLQQAITKSNPNFNFNQANTNSQVQGNLPPAASQASSMLTNLQNTLASAPWYDQTGLPFVNAMGKLLSTVGIGTAGTQAVNSALVDARSAMANALGAANNSTPSTYDGYVQTLLPNDITPSQLQSAISQFNTQIQGKLAAYKSPGNTNFTNNPGSSSSNNTSTQNISGTNFTKVNGQWVAS